MKKKDNLEELFEAAKRHEKDMMRQRKLGELVDEWAAAETAIRKPSRGGTISKTSRGGAISKTSRRRAIWATIGVAAGILLMVSIGLRALQPKMAADTKGIVAKSDQTRSVIDSTSPGEGTADYIIQIEKAAPGKNKLKKKQGILTAENSIEDADTATGETLENEFTRQEDILIAENETTENEEVNVAVTEKKVFVRTSNRLVGKHNNQQRPERRHDDSQNQPLLVFSGAGTSVMYDLGKINF